jgi:transposase
MVQTTECSQAEIARIFKVGERSVRRYLALLRETGDVDSYAKFGGHMKPLLKDYEKRVRELVEATPDITLEALCKALSNDVNVSLSSVYRFIKSLGYSNKKNGVRCGAKKTGRSRTPRGVQKASRKA